MSEQKDYPGDRLLNWLLSREWTDGLDVSPMFIFIFLLVSCGICTNICDLSVLLESLTNK